MTVGEGVSSSEVQAGLLMCVDRSWVEERRWAVGHDQLSQGHQLWLCSVSTANEVALAKQ